jgi:MFS family permease
MTKRTIAHQHCDLTEVHPVQKDERLRLFVYLAYALQAVGLAISWQFTTFFVKHELGSPDFITLTVVFALPAMVTMAAVNVWGWISDRVGRRQPFMIIGFLGYSATFLGYSIVSDSFQYLIVAMIGAVFSAAALPMGQAYLTTKTTKKGERLGTFLAVQSSGWLVGTLSSGFAYQPGMMFVLFQFAAILCITSTGIAVFLIRDVDVAQQEKESELGFKDLLRRHGMKQLTSTVILGSIGMNALSFLLMIMVVDELGGTTAHVGTANALATFFAIIITRYIGRIVDRYGPAKVLSAAYLGYTLFALGFSFVSDPISAMILWALPIYPLSSTAAYGLAAVLSLDEERGKAMSLIGGSQNIGSAIGPIIGGYFAEFVFFRVQPLTLVTLVFNFFAFLIALTLFRKSPQKEL